MDLLFVEASEFSMGRRGCLMLCPSLLPSAPAAKLEALSDKFEKGRLVGNIHTSKKVSVDLRHEELPFVGDDLGKIYFLGK